MTTGLVVSCCGRCTKCRFGCSVVWMDTHDRSHLLRLLRPPLLAYITRAFHWTVCDRGPLGGGSLAYVEYSLLISIWAFVIWMDIPPSVYCHSTQLSFMLSPVAYRDTSRSCHALAIASTIVPLWVSCFCWVAVLLLLLGRCGSRHAQLAGIVKAQVQPSPRLWTLVPLQLARLHRHSNDFRSCGHSMLSCSTRRAIPLGRCGSRHAQLAGIVKAQVQPSPRLPAAEPLNVCEGNDFSFCFDDVGMLCSVTMRGKDTSLPRILLVIISII